MTPRPSMTPGERLLAAMFDAIDREDWLALSRVLHEDIVYHRPGYDALIGRTAVLHFYREVRTLCEGKHHILGAAFSGQLGASWGRFTGRTRAGASANIEYAEWYRFSDGAVVERKSYFFTPLA